MYRQSISLPLTLIMYLSVEWDSPDDNLEIVVKIEMKYFQIKHFS